MANELEPARKRTDADLAAKTAVVAPHGMLPENVLIFRVAEEYFGLRLATISEIIRLPNLVRVPLVPPSLRGLSNLRGIVLPVVSLRALLYLPEIEADEQTRVIITRGDAPVGFVVDRVDRLSALGAAEFGKDDVGAGKIDPELLDGVIKGAEGESTTRLLNPSRLLSRQFVQLGLSATRGATASSAKSAATSPLVQALVPLLSFYVDRQEYALPLDCVREIFPVPDHISELPSSETAVLGVITVRQRLLPLVSLRALLGLPLEGQGQQPRKVVVMAIGHGLVGVVADTVREILRVDPGCIDLAPALLTRGEGDAEISAICRIDGGRRLVAVLSPDRLFRSDLVRPVVAEQRVAIEPELQPEASAMEDEQFIIFRLGNQEYGIPIGAVSEIARPPEHITPLPKAPAFIEGVMNLRGRVVPIVDLRRRFDLGTFEYEPSKRILILAIGRVVAGFLVDGVSEVMKVQTDLICPAPELTPDQMRLIYRVINLEAHGRMILLVDPAQLLDQIEVDVLAKLKPPKREPTEPVP